MNATKLQWLQAIESHLGNSTPDVIYADVMNRDRAPDVDVMISGAPCPPFSSAGKGKAMADARGWLLLSSVKYAVMRKPLVLGLENVKGLANVKNKWILKRIQRILKLAGYKCYCAVMDTKEHGIPQSRPRVYLIASLKKHLRPDRPFSFPEPVPQPRLKRFLMNAGKVEKRQSCPRVCFPMSHVRHLPLNNYIYICVLWVGNMFFYVCLFLFFCFLLCFEC